MSLYVLHTKIKYAIWKPAQNLAVSSSIFAHYCKVSQVYSEKLAAQILQAVQNSECTVNQSSLSLTFASIMVLSVCLCK